MEKIDNFNEILFQVNDEFFTLYFSTDTLHKYHAIQLYIEYKQDSINLSELIYEECTLDNIKEIITHYYRYEFLDVKDTSYSYTAYKILSYLTSSQNIHIKNIPCQILLKIYSEYKYIPPYLIGRDLIDEFLQCYKDIKDITKEILRNFYMDLYGLYKKHNIRIKFERLNRFEIKYFYEIPEKFSDDMVSDWCLYKIITNRPFNIKSNCFETFIIRYYHIITKKNKLPIKIKTKKGKIRVNVDIDKINYLRDVDRNADADPIIKFGVINKKLTLYKYKMLGTSKYDLRYKLPIMIFPYIPELSELIDNINAKYPIISENDEI